MQGDGVEIGLETDREAAAFLEAGAVDDLEHQPAIADRRRQCGVPLVVDEQVTQAGSGRHFGTIRPFRLFHPGRDGAEVDARSGGIDRLRQAGRRQEAEKEQQEEADCGGHP